MIPTFTNRVIELYVVRYIAENEMYGLTKLIPRELFGDLEAVMIFNCVHLAYDNEDQRQIMIEKLLWLKNLPKFIEPQQDALQFGYDFPRRIPKNIVIETDRDLANWLNTLTDYYIMRSLHDEGDEEFKCYVGLKKCDLHHAAQELMNRINRKDSERFITEGFVISCMQNRYDELYDKSNYESWRTRK